VTNCYRNVWKNEKEDKLPRKSSSDLSRYEWIQLTLRIVKRILVKLLK